MKPIAYFYVSLAIFFALLSILLLVRAWKWATCPYRNGKPITQLDVVNVENELVPKFTYGARCSNKCFDCTCPRSHEFLQTSHPAKMSMGM